MSMDYFGGDSAAAALVETAFSVGMLTGSVILGVWGGTKDKIVTMVASELVLGVVLVAAGLLPPTGFWVFAGLSLLMGLSCPFFNSEFMALIQEKVGAGIPRPGVGPLRRHHDTGLPSGPRGYGSFRRIYRHHRMVSHRRNRHVGLRRAHPRPARRPDMRPA